MPIPVGLKLKTKSAPQQTVAPVAPAPTPAPPLTIKPYQPQSLTGSISRYDPNSSTADFLNSVYGDILGRQADTSGMSYWSNILDTGADSRDNVLRNISQSSEFTGGFGDQMSLAPKEPEEPKPPDVFTNAGAEGTTGATGYKTKKSSWRASGKSTKGTGNLKLQIQKGAGGTGLNITG
jgi:hypothetical protein